MGMQTYKPTRSTLRVSDIRIAGREPFISILSISPCLNSVNQGLKERGVLKLKWLHYFRVFLQGQSEPY
jgi:hypothetical protein